MSPFNEKSKNYNPNFVDQLNYLEGIDGTKLSGNYALMKDGKFGIIEGQSMIGRDPQSGLMKYGPGSVLEGKNVISLAGTNNYQTALENYIEKMKGYKVKTDFQKAKIKRAETELQTYLDNEKKKKEEQARKAGQIRLGSNLTQDTTYKSDPRDSQIGREQYTGPGKAFAPRKDTFTGGKTVKSSSTPGGYYSSPRKDGGLMGKGGSRFKSYFDGGLVTLRRR